MAIRLVADVGGTNTRIGLAKNRKVTSGSIRSYRNKNFDSFDNVLDAYMSENGKPTFGEMAIAVAGPSSRGRAKLTNRDWHFDAAALCRAHNAQVVLLNDLSALGYALAEGPAEVETLMPAKGTGNGNGQALVVGIGTGFNVAPVLLAGDHTSCLTVEYGHTSLPSDIAEQVGQIAQVDDFPTVEELFSGRGYRALKDHADPAELDDLYAKLVGLLARNLRLAFLPDAGIYFAGGVARNLFATPARATFIKTYNAAFDLQHIQPAPAFVLSDDAGALAGCASIRMPQIGD